MKLRELRWINDPPQVAHPRTGILARRHSQPIMWQGERVEVVYRHDNPDYGIGYYFRRVPYMENAQTRGRRIGAVSMDVLELACELADAEPWTMEMQNEIRQLAGVLDDYGP